MLRAQSCIVLERSTKWAKSVCKMTTRWHHKLFPEEPVAFIGGQWVKADSGRSFEVTNPATGQVISSVANCDIKDADKAVDAARVAFNKWGFDTTAKERGAILLRWNSLMLEHKEELAALMTSEQGKPLAESCGEVLYSAGFLEWFAGEARRMYGEIVPPVQLGRQHFHFREPAGVAVLITPWNFPSAMIIRKAAAALATGCTCVVKPAEDTPLSALAMASLAKEAGLPDGVFNVVPADRKETAEIGQFLCESENVDVISFTGSTAVGKILLQQSANTVKRVCLELGGNAPFLVFESADLDNAVKGATASKFRCSGQTCVCANRFLVHDRVYEEFVVKLKDAMQRDLVVGDGSKPGVTQGPLVNERAAEKVESLLQQATSNGAEVQLGGKRHSLGKSFYEPTLVTNVKPEMELSKQEIFGPIAAVMRFSTEEEAVRMANNTRVGLAGYFYSQDLAQIFRVSRRMQVGIVGMNEGIFSCVEAAFGGVKESGLGREGSHYGLDEFTNVKYVCLGGL